MRRLKKTLYGVPGETYLEGACDVGAMLQQVMTGIADGADSSILWREGPIGQLGVMSSRRPQHDECVMVTITVERIGRKRGGT